MSIASTNNFVRATTYPKELSIAIKSLEPIFSDHVNFTDPEFVRFYCGRDSQEPRCIQTVINIAKSVYETPRREIANEYGFSFPMYPEVLRYAMKIAQMETVLEIGAARGENTQLLAFSDAKEVYYNELIPTEVAAFKKMKSELPPHIQAKLKDASGNCFHLLQKCPELLHKVGLVFCRNVLQFFNDQETIHFFNLLKNVMKPNGKAIFTVNSSLSFSKDFYEKDPTRTSFMMTRCFFEDVEKTQLDGLLIHERYEPCSKKLINSGEKVIEYKCIEKKLGKPWKRNLEAFRKLPSDLQEKLSRIDFDKSGLRRIKQGSVKYLKTPIPAYHPEQLSLLFKKQGFSILDSFAIGTDGHKVSMQEENWKLIDQIGVVVQYPGAKV